MRASSYGEVGGRPSFSFDRVAPNSSAHVPETPKDARSKVRPVTTTGTFLADWATFTLPLNVGIGIGAFAGTSIETLPFSVVALPPTFNDSVAANSPLTGTGEMPGMSLIFAVSEATAAFGFAFLAATDVLAV